MKRFFSKNWGKLILGWILLIIVGVNFRWGYFILGNDNYSPELNPTLSLNRFVTSPAWRSYRVQGVASDADQADVLRALVFTVLEKILPLWFLSQVWVFFCLIFGVWSMAGLTVFVLKKRLKKIDKETVFLMGGVFYLSSLLTVWIFYSPLVPFMVVWAFLPYLIWRLGVWIKSGEGKWSLVLAWIFISVSGIVPTVFLVVLMTVGLWLVFFGLRWKSGIVWRRVVWAGFLTVVSQLYWVLPFTVYVKSNTGALEKSFVNRMLTPEMVESEVKYNTFWNVPRFVTSWMETKNNDGSWWYPQLAWFRENRGVEVLSFLPLLLVLMGMVYMFWKKKEKKWGFLMGMMFLGWFLIKGVNKPFGGIYAWMQKYIPLFEQVFRWQSSKIWPLMALPLFILAVVGVELVMRVSERKLKYLFLGLLAGGMLFYVKPIFEGNLIRGGNFVKVPEEYFELERYIDKEGLGRERIYLAPEANTLYFRNYDWGFFGSSVVNYIIPNPVIEKALTTGSAEAEMSQKTIQQAFYSQDKEIFAQALKRYGAELLLLDESVSAKQNGYFYDKERGRQMVRDNKDLEEIWQEGSLSLFRVEKETLPNFVEVADGHDWEKLNLAFAFRKDEKQYFSTNGGGGIIYPLVWKYEELRLEEDGLKMKGVYGGEEGVFRVEGDETFGWDNVPLEIDWLIGEKLLTIEPKVPKLWLSGREIDLTRGKKRSLKLDEKPTAVSADDEVYFLDEGGVWGVGLRDLWFSKISFWQEEGDRERAERNEGWPFWVAKEDRIIEAEIEMKVVNFGQINICLWLESEERCLSKNISFVAKEGLNEVKIKSAELVKKGEKVTFFVEEKEEGLELELVKAEVNKYKKVKTVDIGEMLVLGDKDELYTLKRGDLIEMELPIIKGKDSWILSVEDGVGPEMSNVNCSDFATKYLSESKVSFENGGGVNFWARNCWGGIYSKHSLVMPRGGLGILVFEGENFSGIPLDVRIKDDKRGFDYFQQRLAWRKKEAKIDFVIMPEEWKSYYVEVFSQGIGPRESVNRVDWMLFEFVPGQWLGLKLVPEDGVLLAESDLLRTRQAVAAGWKLKGEGKEVRINGWEQGWRGKGEFYYWPNRLAWGGYGGAILGLLSFVVWPENKKRQKNPLNSG